MCPAMSAPIKLKPINCEHVGFGSRVKKGEIDLQTLRSALAPVLKRKKSSARQLSLFAAVDAANADSDCHLHLTVEPSAESEYLDVQLDLVTLHKPVPAKPDFPVTMETIGVWLGPSLKAEVSGSGFARFSYKGPNFKPAIPLPYSGVVPIESSVIRKSSIAGLDVEVGESDIGLRRFFMYKAGSDTIVLSIIFIFAHAINYTLFAKLVERATAISSVLVIKEKHDASVG